MLRAERLPTPVSDRVACEWCNFEQSFDADAVIVVCKRCDRTMTPRSHGRLGRCGTTVATRQVAKFEDWFEEDHELVEPEDVDVDVSNEVVDLRGNEAADPPTYVRRKGQHKAVVLPSDEEPVPVSRRPTIPVKAIAGAAPVALLPKLTGAHALFNEAPTVIVCASAIPGDDDHAPIDLVTRVTPTTPSRMTPSPTTPSPMTLSLTSDRAADSILRLSIPAIPPLRPFASAMPTMKPEQPRMPLRATLEEPRRGRGRGWALGAALAFALMVGSAFVTNVYGGSLVTGVASAAATQMTHRAPTVKRVEAPTPVAPSEIAPLEAAAVDVAPVAPLAPLAHGGKADGLPTDESSAAVVPSVSGARAALARRDYEGAAAQFERVRHVPGAELDGLVGLAEVAHARGDLQTARARYTEAVNISSRYLPAHLGLADTLWDLGDTAAARAEYNEIAVSYPARLLPQRAFDRSGRRADQQL